MFNLFTFYLCSVSVCGLITPRDLVGHGIQFRNHIPKVFVFGLDRTLWPFCVDTEVAMPLFKNVTGDTTVVTDAADQELKLYPHVRHILHTLKLKNITAVAVTRSPEVTCIGTLLKVFDMKQYFSEVVIHPGPKVWHLVWLNNKTLIPFEDMLFFDDGIVDVRYGERLGVVSTLCPQGLYLDDFQRGLDNFQLRTTGEILPDEIAVAIRKKTLRQFVLPVRPTKRRQKMKNIISAYIRRRKMRQFSF